MIFHIHKRIPEAKSVSWAFVALLALFALLTIHKPAVGLSGLGTVLVLAALLVEANRDRIWESYRQDHHRDKGTAKPNRLYYQLNVYVAWPLVLVVGLAAIWAAYAIG